MRDRATKLNIQVNTHLMKDIMMFILDIIDNYWIHNNINERNSIKIQRLSESAIKNKHIYILI